MGRYITIDGLGDGDWYVVDTQSGSYDGVVVAICGNGGMANTVAAALNGA